MQPRRHAAEGLVMVVPGPRSILGAESSSMAAVVHLSVSLDPVCYVGMILAADHGILGCQRAWSVETTAVNVNDR